MSRTKMAQITQQYGEHRKPVRPNDMNLCIWGGCDELRHNGTGFCADHLVLARQQASAEMEANMDHELAPDCYALDGESGQAGEAA